MREAPSLEIIRELIARHARIIAYDPVAMENARIMTGSPAGLTFSTNPMEAAEGSDALIIATEWREFKSPDFSALKAALKTPAIFDGRNLYDPAYVSSFGLEYHAIGRRAIGMKEASK